MPEKSKFEEENLFASPTPSSAGEKAAGEMKPAGKKVKSSSSLRPAEEAARHAWKEKIWEFDLTKPSQVMKDTMKESMLQEGFGKREANKVFKGLFF